MKEDFEFDEVYEGHIGNVDLFSDVQPFVESAAVGINVAILAYGQGRSGKTYTLKGSNDNPGLYDRCVMELFRKKFMPLETSMSEFSISISEVHNRQIRDLLLNSGSDLPEAPNIGELVHVKFDKQEDFREVVESALSRRGTSSDSHLIVTVRIRRDRERIFDWETYNKMSLVELAGSGSTVKDDHVTESLSELRDVLKSLTSQKDAVSYKNLGLN